MCSCHCPRPGPSSSVAPGAQPSQRLTFTVFKSLHNLEEAALPFVQKQRMRRPCTARAARVCMPRHCMQTQNDSDQMLCHIRFYCARLCLILWSSEHRMSK